jgi:hypothetical protein
MFETLENISYIKTSERLKKEREKEREEEEEEEEGG